MPVHTELAPPEGGGILAECSECDATLLVDPAKSRTIIHNDDGSHAYDPEAEA